MTSILRITLVLFFIILRQLSNIANKMDTKPSFVSRMLDLVSRGRVLIPQPLGGSPVSF